VKYRFIHALLPASALWAALALAQQQNEPPKKARLEGSVVSTTGEAIPRAQISLTGQASGAGGGPATPVNLRTTAGDDGKFAIENIEPGRNYQLSAQRPGYVTARYGARSTNGPGSPLTLGAGAELKGLVLTMTPQGVISGRVTDQSGDPVQGAIIYTARRGYQRGVRTLLPVQSAQSNDQGEYRIPNLPPGSYYVVVMDRRVAGLALGANVQGGRTGNVTTFYPNAAEAQGAVALQVNPGSELRGIDVRLRQARMFSIRGKIEGLPAGAVNPSLLAIPKDAVTGANIVAQLGQSAAPVRPPDYAFEVSGLPAGTYVLTPRVQMQANGVNTARMGNPLEVVVADADINGMVVPFGGGSVVTGKVAFEGGDVKILSTASGQNAELLAAAAAAGVVLNVAGQRPTVGLIPVGVLPGVSASSQISETGDIRIEGAAPAKYQINFGSLPAGAYVKSVRFNGQDALRNGIDLTSGNGGELIIVISNRASGISGSVRDERTGSDKLASLAGLMVTLWPREPELGTVNGGVHTAYTDQNGAFQFQALPPGEYFLAAWEEAETGLTQSRDFLTQFTNDAARISVAEGGRGGVDAKVIPAEKIKAAEQKLP
jgi:hypothetical protein